MRTTHNNKAHATGHHARPECPCAAESAPTLICVPKTDAAPCLAEPTE